MSEWKIDPSEAPQLVAGRPDHSLTREELLAAVEAGRKAEEALRLVQRQHLLSGCQPGDLITLTAVITGSTPDGQLEVQVKTAPEGEGKLSLPPEWICRDNIAESPYVSSVQDLVPTSPKFADAEEIICITPDKDIAAEVAAAPIVAPAVTLQALRALLDQVTALPTTTSRWDSVKATAEGEWIDVSRLSRERVMHISRESALELASALIAAAGTK